MDNQLNCLAIERKKKVLRSERFLKEMNAAEPWKRLVVLIESHYADGRLERANDASKQQARARGVCWGILDRAKQGHPLSGKRRRRNRQWARVRAKEEHPFRVHRCQRGYREVRCRGLAKNAAKLWSLFGLTKLCLACRKLPALA